METTTIGLLLLIISSSANRAAWAFSHPQSIVEQPSTSRSRREFFGKIIAASSVLATSKVVTADESNVKSISDAVITDKIFIEFKGIPSNVGDNAAASKDRIVIGLFGQDAPQPVTILKQLVTKDGYKSKCKQLDTARLLQKEQLEANKVYNACLESENTVGVNYDYSSVWRVLRDERIDVGAVSGKFVARENPTFEVAKSNGLVHSTGVVSVRRGDDGGYGFTIFPGAKGSAAAALLDEDNIIVGRVIEGMDVVERLNNMPVVKSSSLNYMSLAGGPKGKNAPTRACRYGGPMYCNENKPLKKVLIESTGIL